MLLRKQNPIGTTTQRQYFPYVILALILLALGCTSALAATRYVSVNGDDQGSAISQGVNNCILAFAPCQTIGHAHSQAANGDTIHLDAGVYQETGIRLTKDLTIRGSSTAATIVRGEVDPNLTPSRVMFVGQSAEVTLMNLIIMYGNARVQGYGGGIRNKGILLLDNVSVEYNQAVGHGGGIFNEGTLTLEDSTVTNNITDDQGGGIYSLGDLHIRGSVVSNNTAYSGGGVKSIGFGILNIFASTLEGNMSTYLGGAIASNQSQTYISYSSLINNTASRGAGIFYSAGNMYIDHSTITGNDAGGIVAAGIYLLSGTISMNDSTLSGNNGPNCQNIDNNATLSGNNNIIDDSTCLGFN